MAQIGEGRDLAGSVESMVTKVSAMRKGSRSQRSDRDVVGETIAELRRHEESPQVFCPRMTKLLAGCGVALVFVWHLPKTGAQGATQWVGRKAIVQLSVRYKWADVFWFSLFHELGHLLLHQHKGVCVNPSSGAKSDRSEKRTLSRAMRFIPRGSYKRFTASVGVLSADAVEAFARDIEVDPSIIVGRLQHESLVPHSRLNELRRRFEIVSA